MIRNNINQQKDLLIIQNLNKKEIISILTLAEANDIKSMRKNTCDGRILACMFFEPSTRTRLSFESAMLRLGGKVIGASSLDFTSIAKGESLADTARMVSAYADLLVVRHPIEGSTKTIADYADIPVINAGDGSHQHPTQALVDLYTIMQQKGQIDGLRVGLFGDLKFGRAAHSLTYALSCFEVEIVGITRRGFELPDYVSYELAGQENQLEYVESLDEVISDLDVLYISYGQEGSALTEQEYRVLSLLREDYSINKDVISKAKTDMLLLHPLPRRKEIVIELDDDTRALYFKQAANGIPVRMALIEFILNLDMGHSQMKEKYVMPDVECVNSQCVTQHESYLSPTFKVLSDEPCILQCVYCEALQ